MSMPQDVSEEYFTDRCDDGETTLCDRCASHQLADDCTLRAGEMLCPKCLSADDDASCGGECKTVDPDTGRCMDCDRPITTINHAPPIGPDAPGVLMPLSFDRLRLANVTRSETSFGHALNDWSPSDWAMAAAGEMGETCNALKKRLREDVDAPDLEDVGDEIADTICYLDLLAARLGIDLGEAVRRKFNKVSDRRRSEIRL